MVTAELAGSFHSACGVSVQVALSCPAGVVHVDDFQLRVEVDRDPPHFAKSYAGRFHAAEWNVGFAADGGGVDVQDPGVQPIDEPEHRGNVVGVDRGGQ